MNKHIFVGVATGVYAITFLAVVNTQSDSMQILSIALIGLWGWVYGIWIGLLSIALFALINTTILFFSSENLHYLLLTAYPIGTLLSVLIVLITAVLQHSQKKLNQLKRSLSDQINEATKELDTLAQQLIDTDEKFRIQIGQDLHDGIGQYLTGMLLYSESLHLKLRKANHPQTALAEKMTERIEESMQLVRQLSRSQLPLHIAKATLEVALEEMTAYFSEVSATKFCLKHTGNSRDLPVETAQHLYRIVHETIFCAIQKCKAKNVDIRLVIRPRNCMVDIEATKMPTPPPLLLSGFVSKIMEYRAKAIGGKLTLTTPPGGGFRLKCSTVFEEEIE